MSSSYIVYSPIGSDPDSLTAAINIPNRETSSIRNLSNPVRGNRSFRLLNENNHSRSPWTTRWRVW